MFLLCGNQRHLSAYFKSIVDLIYGLINSLNSDEKMSVERGKTMTEMLKERTMGNCNMRISLTPINTDSVSVLGVLG